MLQCNHFELLDKLRFGKDSDARKEALRELVYLEHDERLHEADILELLNDPDPAIQVYAIGAIGRLKLAAGIPELTARYVESSDPLILNELLNAFQQFASDHFLETVLEKLRKLGKKPGFFQKALFKPEKEPEREFLLDQILMPSLKYIEATGNPGVEKAIRAFLDHEDGSVRWQTLKLYDHLAILIRLETLKEMATSDPNPLVREQANILISKRTHK